MNVLAQGFRYFLIVISLLPVFAIAANDPFVTTTDKPFRLIRGTDVYLIGTGTALQKGDILETDAAAVQIEIPPSTIISLQPRTSLMIAALTAQPELVILAGWIKLETIASSGEARAEIVSPLMRAGTRNGSILFHAALGSAEVFAEHAGQVVAEVNGAIPAASDIKLNTEQYVVRVADQPVKIPPRPPKEFLGAIPVPFRGCAGHQIRNFPAA